MVTWLDPVTHQLGIGCAERTEVPGKRREYREIASI
jgi:hypothetical protein